MKPGPKPTGERALTAAERQARYRAAQAAGVKPVRYRRPAGRRSRPQQWEDAVGTLQRCLDAYQAWRDSLPASLAEAAIGERLDMSCWSCVGTSRHWRKPICPGGSGATETGATLQGGGPQRLVPAAQSSASSPRFVQCLGPARAPATFLRIIKDMGGRANPHSRARSPGHDTNLDHDTNLGHDTKRAMTRIWAMTQIWTGRPVNI